MAFFIVLFSESEVAPRGNVRFYFGFLCPCRPTVPGTRPPTAEAVRCAPEVCMLRLTPAGFVVIGCALTIVAPSMDARQQATGSALAVEDYYRIQTVGNPGSHPMRAG